MLLTLSLVSSSSLLLLFWSLLLLLLLCLVSLPTSTLILLTILVLSLTLILTLTITMTNCCYDHLYHDLFLLFFLVTNTKRSYCYYDYRGSLAGLGPGRRGRASAGGQRAATPQAPSESRKGTRMGTPESVTSLGILLCFFWNIL